MQQHMERSVLSAVATLKPVTALGFTVLRDGTTGLYNDLSAPGAWLGGTASAPVTSEYLDTSETVPV